MKGFPIKAEDKKSIPFAFLKSLAAGYALTAVVFMVLAIALTYTDLSEDLIPIVVFAATGASCFLGGIISGRHIKAGGLICGVLSALLYILAMLVIGIFAGSRGSVVSGSVPIIVMSLGAGALGGILGVNM